MVQWVVPAHYASVIHTENRSQHHENEVLSLSWYRDRVSELAAQSHCHDFLGPRHSQVQSDSLALLRLVCCVVRWRKGATSHNSVDNRGALPPSTTLGRTRGSSFRPCTPTPQQVTSLARPMMVTP